MSVTGSRANGRIRPARDTTTAPAPEDRAELRLRRLVYAALASLVLLALLAAAALLDAPFLPGRAPVGGLGPRALLIAAIALLPVAFAIAADRLLGRAKPARAPGAAAAADDAAPATRVDLPLALTDAAGRLRWANAAFVRALGHLPEDFEQDPLWDTVISTRSAQPERERLANALKAGEAARCELALHARDGHVAWYDVILQPLPAAGDDRPCDFAVALADARSRVEVRERYAALMAALPAGVVVRDAQGRIVEVNDAAARLLEADPADLLGRATKDPRGVTVDEHGHSLPEERHPGLIALRSGEAQIGTTLGIPLANGLVRWLRVNAAPLRDADGEVTGSISCLVDKTASQVERRVLRVAMDSAQAGLWTWNCRAGTEPVLLDRRWLATLGYDPAKMDPQQAGWLDFVAPEDGDLVREHLRRAIGHPPQPLRVEFRMRDGTGREVWMLCAGGLVLRDTARRPATLAGVLLNINPRKELETALAREAALDALTGLANRRGWLGTLEGALERRRADPGARFAVLLIDIDRFKLVNDGLGLDAGDDLLRQIADRLRHVLHAGDDAAQDGAGAGPRLARMGGDEFAVLIQPVNDAAAAEQVARRVSDAIAHPYRIANRRIHVTASIGVVGDDTGGDTVETLLRDADLALHEAKRRGRARWIRFDGSLHAQALRRLDLESGLRRALEFDDEIRVVYQPIVDMHSRLTMGVEALARWNHPYRGEIPPDDFIPVAEDSTLIVPVGRVVLRRACEDMARWLAAYGDAAPRWIAVNLSRTQIEDARLVDDVRDALKSAGLDPGRLRIEVTESLSTELGDGFPGLTELRELGVTVSIDDFGTGYSSLAALRRLPVDAVKIDRALITEIDANPAQRAIVEATVAVARSLQLDVVTEGIERAEQADALLALGCRYGQGYLYGPPAPASKFELLLEAARMLPGGGDAAEANRY